MYILPEVEEIEEDPEEKENLDKTIHCGFEEGATRFWTQRHCVAIVSLVCKRGSSCSNAHFRNPDHSLSIVITNMRIV